MQREKLKKLQKHLRTLKLFKVKEKGHCMVLQKSNDKTRFAIGNLIVVCQPVSLVMQSIFLIGIFSILGLINLENFLICPMKKRSGLFLLVPIKP